MDLAGLQRMKREGRKIVGVVAWDCPMAQIAERAGADLVSVGDSVGVNLWGQKEGEITLEEMLVVLKAVRRGARRALVSCDLPPALISVTNAKRLADAGADVIKIEGSAQAVRHITQSGIPVFAEFHGGAAKEALVEKARQLESAGAVLLDFRHSGPEAGAAVAQAVSIPVLGGLGGGPWLDGRLRMAHAAIGYGVAHLDSKIETYANVARLALEAIEAYADDVRSGRQLKGQRPA
jgi:3-methyl-2-oxobutanoate hydroxymethyltransferase